MQPTDDNALLRQFAETQSDEAFAALVTRHINLVYSVALRQTGQPHHAEEIAQAVFIILAKKAAGLRHEQALTSWLFQTTRLTANNFVRSEMRRRHREQEAYMESVLNESAHDVWPKIAPLLDNAVGSLREKDRRAILLRFYEGRNLREVSVGLGASEAAAEKRVSRALDKLRQFFLKRGVNSTTAAIGDTISANSVLVAPAALAKTVTAVALAKGATTSISTFTLVKGALKIMAWTKAKTAVVVAIAALLTAGTTTVIVRETISPSIRDDNPVWEMNPDGLAKAPPVVIVRPTHFHDAQGRGAGDTNGFVGGRFMGLQPMIASAYNWPFTRMVLPTNMPPGPFDYLFTVRDRSKDRFQAEIKKRLGWVARREIRETGVFLLKVKTPDAAGIVISDGMSPWTTENSRGSWIDIHQKPISALAGNLEGFFAKPIIDQTGLTNRYDTITEWTQTGNYRTDEKSLQKALLDQLGLELVPTNMPLEMLVVERAK